jgi:hypothetical protein
MTRNHPTTHITANTTIARPVPHRHSQVHPAVTEDRRPYHGPGCR